VSGVYVGPAQLGAAFTPAHPGDVVTVYASGFGPTNPPTAPGATAPAAAPVAGAPITVRLGAVTLVPEDVLYAGAVPGEPISQLNIPSGCPGRQSAAADPHRIRSLAAWRVPRNRDAIEGTFAAKSWLEWDARIAALLRAVEDMRREYLDNLHERPPETILELLSRAGRPGAAFRVATSFRLLS